MNNTSYRYITQTGKSISSVTYHMSKVTFLTMSGSYTVTLIKKSLYYLFRFTDTVSFVFTVTVSFIFTVYDALFLLFFSLL